MNEIPVFRFMFLSVLAGFFAIAASWGLFLCFAWILRAVA